MERSTGESGFTEVLRVFEGHRRPLDAKSSKVLCFMLEGPEGCDATIEPGRFEIVFGWNPARHRYVSDTAPGVLSYLIESMCPLQNVGDLQAVVGPARVPSMAFGYTWAFERRRVWISRHSSNVTIMIRNVRLGESLASTLPLPAPIDVPTPILMDSTLPISCPTCGAESSRYRVLPGGFLVCSSCGCSFVPPSEVAAQLRVAADGAAPRR
jgi:hypothetical protein